MDNFRQNHTLILSVISLGVILIFYYAGTFIQENDFTAAGHEHLKDFLANENGIHKYDKVERTGEDYFLPLDDPQLIENTKTLVYNRVPKSGSGTLLGHMKVISKLHNITFENSHINYFRHINITEQKKLLHNLSLLQEPWIFIRHVHFINFPEFGKQMPIYINQVRHPIDRFISRYNNDGYVPTLKGVTINQCIEKKYPRCIDVDHRYETLILVPFFCGQMEFCIEPSRRAMEQAKANAIKFYSFIGLLEQLEDSFHLLECLLPKYFSGLWSLKENEDLDRHITAQTGEALTSYNRKKLEKTLQFDIEFYNFLKQRFQKLLNRVKANKICPSLVGKI